MQGELDFDDVVSNVTDCAEPGIHRDIPFETYAAWKAVNSGVVKWGQISPKHFHAAYNGEIKSEDSRSMKLGRAIHCLLLEPDAFAERFVVGGSCEAVLKSGENKGKMCLARGLYLGQDDRWYCGKHQPEQIVTGREVITSDEHSQCLRVQTSLKSHPAMTLMRRSGWSECSVVWEHAGLPMKGRLDRYCATGSRPVILDVKKCRVGHGVTEQCEKSILNYGYAVQAALYVDGVTAITGTSPEFLWLFVEDSAPFDVQILPASKEVLAIGRHIYRAAISAYLQAVQSGDIYGYVRVTEYGGETINNIHEGGLPLWYLKLWRKNNEEGGLDRKEVW